MGRVAFVDFSNASTDSCITDAPLLAPASCWNLQSLPYVHLPCLNSQHALSLLSVSPFPLLPPEPFPPFDFLSRVHVPRGAACCLVFPLISATSTGAHSVTTSLSQYLDCLRRLAWAFVRAIILMNNDWPWCAEPCPKIRRPGPDLFGSHPVWNLAQTKSYSS